MVHFGSIWPHFGSISLDSDELKSAFSAIFAASLGAIEARNHRTGPPLRKNLILLTHPWLKRRKNLHEGRPVLEARLRQNLTPPRSCRVTAALLVPQAPPWLFLAIAAFK
jgi:hypothetical protein